MNGYYRPKAHGPIQELRPLELDEIEYISEDERPEVKRVLDEAWKHRCPRCGIVSWIIFHEPHCSECNWDSLTDASRNGALCVS